MLFNKLARPSEHSSKIFAVLVVAGLVLGATPATAQSVFASDYEAIVAAAATEEPVHACSILSEKEFQPVIDGFSEMFPDVKPFLYERCNGIDPRERILNEYAAGQVFMDIFDPGAELLQRTAESGFAEKPDWSVFKGTPLEIDERFIASGEPWNGLFLAAGSWSPVIVYNKNLLTEAEAPSAFEDCADPKWRGQFMLDIRPNQYPVFLKVWGEERLREWARAVGENDPMWTRGSSIFGRLSAGERKFHCGYTVAAVLRAIKGGASNLAYKFPKETPAPFAQHLMIAKGTKSPNSALLIAAYWASKHGQLKVAEGNPGYGSPLIDETWKAQEIKKAGVTLLPTGWDYGTYADDASAMIVEEWGFPTATN